MSDDNEATKIKIVLIGGPSVGKTSLIKYFIDGSSSLDTKPTLQLAYQNKDVTINDVVVRLNICDTAGQEKFQSVAPNFYRSSDAAMIVFDITEPSSFEKAQEWLDELNAAMPDTYMILIVGNKNDLPNRKISYEEAAKYANSNDVTYMESSAQSGDGVENCFYFLAEKVLSNRKTAPEFTTETIDIAQQPQTTPEEKKKGCC